MRFVVILFFCFYQSLYSQISSDLQRKMLQELSIPVIIQLKDQANLSGTKESWSKERKALHVYNTLKTKAETSQKEILTFLNREKAPHRSFYLVNAIWANLRPDQIQEISQMPAIAKISYDSYQQAIPTQDKNISLSQRAPEVTWGIKRVGTEKVWNKGIEGQGVVVGGCDTGIKWDIPAIKDRYRGFANNQVDHNYNWHDAIHQNSPLSTPDDNPCGLNLKEPCDDHSHGTHTIGTVVGLTKEHAIGMAPKAQWIGCRNMERGNGAPSTYIECFEFFLAPFDLDGLNPKPELGPHVINNSWYCSLQEGCDTSTFPIMELVVENLRTAGIVVVVSAGNDGAACNTLRHIPALYKNSFTVGAIASNDTISGFSSNGPVNNYRQVIVKPNVVAPGSDILSMLPDGSYASWSGTSMAGPHVAGLVALMISANPLIAGHVEQIESIIEETVEPFSAGFDCFPFSGNNFPNNTYGYGLINADKAVEKAMLAVQTNEEEELKFHFYPNPAIQEIQIVKQMNETLNIRIEDIFGRICLQQIINKSREQVIVSGLKPGVYFIRNDKNDKIYQLIKL